MENQQALPFGISSIPPLHLLIFLALQQTINLMGGPLSTVYMVHATLCADGDNVFFAQLLSTNIFLSGVCTLVQILLGVRLPVVQGSAYSFIPPMVAMMSTDRWRCPTSANHTNSTFEAASYLNHQTTDSFQMVPHSASGGKDLSAVWRPRMLEVNGGLIVASLVQVVMGVTGVMGFLIRYIGPLTIVPTIALIPLTIYKGPVAGMAHHWGIAMTALVSMILFTVVLGKLDVPIPWYSRKDKCHTNKYPIFRFLPNLLSIATGWALAAILTAAGTLPTDPNVLGYKARTDAKLDVLHKTTWFFFPYPGHFGMPRFSIGISLGMLAAMITSVVESMGDYYACARVCQVPNPPKHAVNRGIFMEGFGNVFAGFLGASCGTCTYSSTIGMIGVTGIGSRAVFSLTALLMVLCGVIGKVGAALTLMPDPIMGGLSVMGMGVMLSIAFANLKHVDLAAPRNTVTLGVSLMLGMMVPEFFNQHRNAIKTGSEEVDNVLTVLLSTGMFVGGFTGFILDNILPGTLEERGMLRFLQSIGVLNETDIGSDKSFPEVFTKKPAEDPYQIPYIHKCLNRYKIFSYIPCLPSYKEWDSCSSCCRSGSKNQMTSSDHSGDKTCNFNLGETKVTHF